MVDRLDSLHFVVFTSAPAKGSAFDLWNSVLSASPDSFSHQQPVGSQASGRVENYAVTLQVQPNRIDLIIGPIEQEPRPTADAPYLENPDRAFDLGAAWQKKLAFGQEVQRPAIVVNASEPCESASEAVEIVLAKVPQLPRREGAVDISYQTTVSRPSKVDSQISTFRIARWNTGQRQLLQFNPTTGPIQLHVAFVAVRYIDVYAAASKALHASNFAAIADEVVTVARAILSGGYDAL